MKSAALRGACAVLLALTASPGCSAEAPLTSGGDDTEAAKPAELTPPKTLPDATLAQIRALRDWKRSWTPVQQKIAGRLLLQAARARGRSSRSAVDLRAALAAPPGGLSRVEVSAVVDGELLDRIEALGGTVEGAVPEFDTVVATLPLLELEELAKEPSVFGIEPALGFLTNKVDTSEGDVAHHADVIRAIEGVDGNGVKIGVLSDGVATIAERQATGDLPDVQVLDGQGGSGDEGTAMLEIVHDLAPGAALMFATAQPSRAQFALNILNLRAAGCDIIVDDVFYFAEATFQDDLVARAVEAVVADGALYFSSAGNSGSLARGTAGVYEGDYVATSPVPSAILDVEDAYSSVHVFAPDVVGNVVSRDAPYLFTLEWSEPLGRSSTDFDLFLLSPDLSTVIDAGMAAQSGFQDPFEFIDSSSADDRDNVLVIAHYSGSSVRHVRVNTHRGRLSVATAGQVSGHAAAQNAFAIAAVDVDQATGGLFSPTNGVEWFSSDGPRRMFFDEFGNALTPTDLTSSGGVVRDKPDFAAADGVSTSTPGFNPFHGTSAAAPHAAALAALVLEARPDIRAQAGVSVSNAVREAFLTEIVDIEAQGSDELSGLGTLMADAAAGPCQNVTCVPLDDCHEAGVCDPETGECTNPVKADGASCDDGNACTVGDSCAAGVCTAGEAVTCVALDDCHEAGVCDPETGECTDPARADGASCDDGNACTRTDSCEAGSCIGDDAVVCTASDQCHEAGTCDPLTGACSNPERPDWVVCDDGNACTGADRCVSGACRGFDPVVCTARDSCHDPGTCHPATGTCSDVPKPDQTPCDDGNACTQGDACGGGQCQGTPLVCQPVDQCHQAGTCNPETGTCSTPLQVDGAQCDDGNACTRSDSCQTGVCRGGQPVVCEAPDQCHAAGTCNPQDGVCGTPVPLEDIACDDGNVCTRLDRCRSGLCVGGDAVVCEALDPCHVPGTCEPESGMCTHPPDPAARDTDGDLICDVLDQDDDGDGVVDSEDSAPHEPSRCKDGDGDGCDDCARHGVARPDDDGPDFDADGVCDETDPPPELPEVDSGAAPGDAGAPPGDAGTNAADGGPRGNVGANADAGAANPEPEPREPDDTTSRPNPGDAGPSRPTPPQDDPDDEVSEPEAPTRDDVESWLGADAGLTPDLASLVPDGGIVFRAPLPSCACELEQRGGSGGAVPLLLLSLSVALAAGRRAFGRH